MHNTIKWGKNTAELHAQYELKMHIIVIKI